jgi:hypothetical protein
VYLVHYKDDYADEFEISGFQIFEDLALARYLEEAKRCLALGTQYYYFGSNEEVEFTDFEDLMRHFRILEITLHDKSVIDDLFTIYERGEFPEFYCPSEDY